MAEQRVEIRVQATGAEQAAKVLAAIAKEGGQIGSILSPAVKRAEDSLNSLGGTARRVFEIFTGVGLANAVGTLKQLGEQAYQAGLQGMQAERAFRGMASALNIDTGPLLAKMESVSKGLADMSDIALASARGLQQGLSGEQLVKVLELATDRARIAGKTVAQAYNEISDAISENNLRALKQFGIVLDLDEVLKRYAHTLGTYPEALSQAEKTQAIYNATMEKSATQTRTATTAMDEQVERIEKNSVRTKKFWADIGTQIVNVHGELLAFWQDFDKAAEDFGKRKLGELGIGLAPGPSEGRAGGIGTSDITRGAPSPPVAIPPEVIAAPDLLKRALADADHTLKMLNATMAAGQSTSVEYAAALQVAINKLQALGTTLDEDGRLKLLGFQAALAAINFAKFQQGLTASLQATQAWGAALISSVRESVAQWNSTVAQGAVAEADIRVAMLAADRSRLAQALVDFKGNEAQKFQLEQQYAALGVLLAQAKSAQRIAVWDKERAALKDFIDQLNSGIDAGLRAVTQGTDDYAREVREADEAQQKFAAGMDVMMGATDSTTDEFDRQAAAIRRSKGAFQDLLAGLGREATLVGTDFDLAAANLNAFKTRLLELQAIKNPTGAVLEEVAQLKAQFADTQSFIKWRDMFQDVFSSVGGAITTLVQGVILGTQTMGEAFKKLAQSIIINFANAVIQQALNPLMKAAASVVAGIFAPTSKAAAAALGGGGGGGSSGDIDFGGGAGGGGGGSVPSIPTGLFDIGTLSNAWTSLGSAWTTFNAALDGGASVMTGLSEAWEAGSFAFDAMSGAASGLTVALAGVGAAVSVFSTVMDLVNGKTAEGIGGIVGGTVGAVAGGLIGTYLLPGIGTVLGALGGGVIGDFIGSMLGGLFGGPSNYTLKRTRAADDALGVVGGIGTSFQTAAATGNRADVLAALQSGQAPAGSTPNPLRTDLVLSSALAAQLGLKGETEGDKVIIHWAEVNAQQFDQLIALFQQHPDMIASSIRGGGDVSYLTPDKVRAYTDALQQGAVALVTSFTALDTVKGRINTMGSDLKEATAKILPRELADRFAHGIVDPIRDRMLAIFSSGLPVEEMQQQLDALSKELNAWVGLVALYGQVTQDMAALSGDLATQTGGAVLAIETVMTSTKRAVIDAQTRVDMAVGPEEMLTAQTALRTAILQRYSTEMQLVQKIQAGITELLKAASDVQATLAGLAGADLARGDATAFTQMLRSLADLAMVAPTVAQRLFAVSAGLATIATALTNADLGKTLDPLTIIAQASGAAAPFFGALADLIAQATSAGDLQGALGLLQQQAALIAQLGAAAVQAVKNWSAAAIAAAEKQAAADLKAINDRAEAETKTREAAIKGWQAQLSVAQAIETLYTGPNSPLTLTEQTAAAAQAGARALAAFTANPTAAGLATVQSAAQRYLTIFTALITDQIALLQRWQTAIDSARGYIESLYTGPNSPLTLTQQRGLAGNAGMAALTAYNANPTPEGLGALQAAASRYLTIALAQIREKADAEIAAVTAAKDARVEALNDELTALQAQVQATREWEAVVKSTAALITALRIGPLAAGNPADRLRAAKDAFGRAQADFNAHPSAAGAAAVQSAAQALLPLAESVLSKPSPAYQALFAGVIRVLEHVQGTAGAQAGPVTSADLDAQTKVIQQQLADANKNAADTIAAINAAAAQEAKDITAGVIAALEAAIKKAPPDPAGQIADKQKELKDTVAAVIGILAASGRLNGMTADDLTTLIAGAQAEIDWWTKWRTEQSKLVDDLKQAHIDAINATAKTTIDNIEAGVAAALRANAAAQTSITDKLLGVQLDQLNAITHGSPVQTFMADQARLTVEKLQGILDALNRAIPAESGMERVTEGLYHLHDDEMVLPKAMAKQIRSAADGAGLSSTKEDWLSPFFQPRDLGVESRIWAGPGAAELNDLERRILLLQVQYGTVVTDNTYKSGGKIRQHHDAAELATMKATVDAQIGTLRSQQRDILAAIPKTPPPPPPGTPPTTPVTPPGPAWLSRGGTDAAQMGGGPTGGGIGPVTIVLQVDGKTVGTTVLPTVLADARSGKLSTIFVKVK